MNCECKSGVCCRCGIPIENGVRRNCATQVSIGKPGAELKEILARLGFQPSLNCKCSSKARAMDLNGADWCEQNIDTIVEWLKEEATKRGLPFMAMPAKILVRRAISNAKKNAASNAVTPGDAVSK